MGSDSGRWKMGNGSTKHGDAHADKLRDEFSQLDIELERAMAVDAAREEMQSAHDLEEDSKLTAALLAQKPAVVVVKDGHDSDRPPATWKGWVWKLALVLVAAIGAGVAAALGHH